jgi:hypothetical protein
MRRLLTWVRRLVLLGMLIAVAQRLFRWVVGSGESGGGGGGETLPPIVGDTWPPVPTNPDRGD